MDEQKDDYQMSKKERREQRKEVQRNEVKSMRRKESQKRWMLWGGVALILIVGLYGVTRLAGGGPVEGQPELLVGEISATDWSYGNEDAPVHILEYSDFQCPACKQFYPVVRQLEEAFPQDVLVTYRHYPLRQIHPNAQLAGQAAEAAGIQGKFWEMHDRLFDTQSMWENGGSRVHFIDLATELELDIDKFKGDMGSSELKDIVNNNYNSAIKNGLTGTPSFFINGQRIQNPRGYEAFEGLVLAELERLGLERTPTDEESLNTVVGEDESGEDNE